MTEGLKKSQNTRVVQIAIDGDAGSGKTTIGKILAEKLAFEFIDSGLFYRLATFLIIREGIQLDKRNWLKTLDTKIIEFVDDSFVVGGEKILNELLRSKEVEDLVSDVSKPVEVRDFITNSLRKIASNLNVVMVGRDIGTVVLKDAFLKVYLTATIEERAKRRYEELLGKGFDVVFDDVIENLKKRDLMDSSRENSPLAIALDAYVIDTTDISIQEVVEKIFLFLEGKKYALRISSRPR